MLAISINCLHSYSKIFEMSPRGRPIPGHHQYAIQCMLMSKRHEHPWKQKPWYRPSNPKYYSFSIIRAETYTVPYMIINYRPFTTHRYLISNPLGEMSVLGNKWLAINESHRGNGSIYFKPKFVWNFPFPFAACNVPPILFGWNCPKIRITPRQYCLPCCKLSFLLQVIEWT